MRRGGGTHPTGPRSRRPSRFRGLGVRPASGSGTSTPERCCGGAQAPTGSCHCGPRRPSSCTRSSEATGIVSPGTPGPSWFRPASCGTRTGTTDSPSRRSRCHRRAASACAGSTTVRASTASPCSVWMGRCVGSPGQRRDDASRCPRRPSSARTSDWSRVRPAGPAGGRSLGRSTATGHAQRRRTPRVRPPRAPRRQAGRVDRTPPGGRTARWLGSRGSRRPTMAVRSHRDRLPRPGTTAPVAARHDAGRSAPAARVRRTPAHAGPVHRPVDGPMFRPGSSPRSHSLDSAAPVDRAQRRSAS
jgi:hypothetical protein